MQKPVYLPQYTGHSEKGSTPLLNVQAVCALHKYIRQSTKNVDLWDMDVIINLSSNMDLHICSQNVHFMFAACSPVFGYIIGKES